MYIIMYIKMYIHWYLRDFLPARIDRFGQEITASPQRFGVTQRMQSATVGRPSSTLHASEEPANLKYLICQRSSFPRNILQHVLSIERTLFFQMLKVVVKVQVGVRDVGVVVIIHFVFVDVFVDVSVTVHFILHRHAYPTVVYCRPPLVESLPTLYTRYGPVTRHGAVYDSAQNPMSHCL